MAKVATKNARSVRVFDRFTTGLQEEIRREEGRVLGVPRAACGADRAVRGKVCPGSRRIGRMPQISRMNDVVEVRYVRDYTLWLRFQDGTAGEVDIEPSFKGPVFEPLRDIEFFKQVSIDHEIGTIVWPNGADIAPETLYARVHVTV
jgi:hypothetical protein